MTLDLVLLGLVLLFALLGAFQGAARQTAQAVALVGAWFAACPVGEFFGSPAARVLRSSLVIGNVFATFAAFVVVFLGVRFLLTLALQRLLAGKDPTNRTADRTLGFFIGGLKVAAMICVVVCALSFIEDNLTLQGKSFGLVPKDSITFQLARKYNLFELSQFSGVKEVARVSKLLTDPKSQHTFRENRDFQLLAKDPRFHSLHEAPELKKALAGDTRALLQNNQVLLLLQDPQAMRRVFRITELSDQ